MDRGASEGEPETVDCFEQTVACLTQSGATVLAGTSLKAEHGAKVDCRVSDDEGRVARLKIDHPTASYRRSVCGSTSPICDFGVVRESDASIGVSVVEIKSGAADLGAVEQLQGGVDAIAACIPDGCHATLETAVVVAGKLERRLMQALRTRKSHVKMNGVRREVRVLRSGTTLNLG